MTYRTFLRRARNFEEFSTARKHVQERGLRLEEARERCEDFNTHRTTAQIINGTKLEFERED